MCLRHRRTIQEKEIPSFVPRPSMILFHLVHAAAMERLHRAAGSPVDNRKHPGICQHLFVDDILADQRRTYFAGSIGAMADDAVRYAPTRGATR
jgi:hypothetical protein